MKTELKRLIENTESIIFSTDNSGNVVSRLLFMLPESKRSELTHLSVDLQNTFALPSALLLEKVKNNVYNLEWVVDDDNCVIGQVNVDPYTLAQLEKLTLSIQASFRINEKVNISIDELDEEKLVPKKDNVAAIQIDTTGEASISSV